MARTSVAPTSRRRRLATSRLGRQAAPTDSSSRVPIWINGTRKALKFGTHTQGAAAHMHRLSV